MKNIIRDNFIVLKKCGKTLLIYELIYKIIAVAVFYPLFLLLFNLSFKVAGIKYLTNGYIAKYFSNPFTIMMIAGTVFVIAVYTFFEKCCLSVVIEAAMQNRKIKVADMFHAGVNNFYAKFRRKNMSLLLYEIFLFPFSNIIILGLAMTNLTVPEFITRAFGSKNMMYFIIMAVCLALFIFAVREIFTPNYLIYGSENVNEAYKRSASLLHGRTVRTILLILFWNVFVSAIVGVLFLVISLVVIVGIRILNFTHAGIAVYLTVIKAFKNIIS